MSSDKKITRRAFLKKTGVMGGMVAFGGFQTPKQSFAQTKEPFRVGFPIPLTGPYGTEAKDQQAGAELAAAEINAKGGVLGRKVEILVRDDKLKADEGARRAKELIERRKIKLVLSN